MDLLGNKKRGNHHWWPESLQKHWVDSDGKIRRRKGDIVESKNPKNGRTGCKRNAHFHDLGESPWSHSFEAAFDAVDSKGAEAVRQAIEGVQSHTGYKIARAKLVSWLPLHAAATDTKCDCLSSANAHHLARLAISIFIRSPAFQFQRSIVHPAFNAGRRFDAELGKASTWQYWSTLYNNPQFPIEHISIVFLVNRREREFVMGDGLYQSGIDRERFVRTQSGGWRASFSGAIVFPLSPDICALVLINSTLGQRVAILSKGETAEINRIIYQSSRNEIYFRYQDQPEFEPYGGPGVRSVFVNEYSFLRSWIDTTHAPKTGD